MRTEEKRIPKCFGSVFPHHSVELHPQLDIISPDQISLDFLRMEESVQERLNILEDLEKKVKSF